MANLFELHFGEIRISKIIKTKFDGMCNRIFKMQTTFNNLCRHTSKLPLTSANVYDMNISSNLPAYLTRNRILFRNFCVFSFSSGTISAVFRLYLFLNICMCMCVCARVCVCGNACV